MNIKRAMVAFASFTAAVGMAESAWGQASANGQRLSAVPIPRVTIDDPFWSPKFQTWRTVTINDSLDKFERDGVLTNFDRVAQGKLDEDRCADVKHGGLPWFDGLTYEMIRACADFMLATPDPALKARLDGYIDRIAAAAATDPNGYLNTYTQLKEPDHRWGQNGGNDRWQHDLYNAACLIEAGVHYYRATGETKLLGVAVRMANGMCDYMGPSPKQNLVPGHALGEESFTRLYELFMAEPALAAKVDAPVRADDYLALAKFWIDNRGNHAGRTNFSAYNQDAMPGLEQQTIEGHAVRAALFAAGMVAVGEASDDGRYVDAAQRLWDNMVGRRMYITGGIGSFADDEKFGPDYVLPNDGYLETCAAVANVFFSHNLNLARGDARAADEVERALYNNALSGVSHEGRHYTYVNPLQFGPDRERWSWHPCPCCPPMFLKLMGALPGYIYATDDSGAYVNLFIGSTAKVKAGGTDVTITQRTTYPWSGDVKITVDPVTSATFDLNVRVPGWVRGGPSTGALYNAATPGEPDAFAISVNGQPVATPTVERGYAKINRTWKAGDVVEVKMKMPVQRVTADERVESNRGRVAYMRGPLVFCFESVDNGGRLNDVFVPGDAEASVAEDRELLEGVTVLNVDGRRKMPDGSDAAAKLKAIPYYANANRGPTDMQVWMPASADVAPTPTIASLAKPSASHRFDGDTFAALNEASAPINSSDGKQKRFSWWDRKGSAEWIQYDLDQPRRIASVDVYWWDDSKAGGGCSAPQSWRLLYKAADGSWQPVQTTAKFTADVDEFNTVAFTPVTTSAVRIEAQLAPGRSAGLLRWRIVPAE